MGTITKRKNRSGITTYRAEVRVEGKRVTQSFKTRTHAKLWTQSTETTIRSGEFVPELRKHTLAEAITRYTAEVLPNKRASTQVLHTLQLNWFKERIGKHKLSTIASDTLLKARQTLLQEKIHRNKSPETTNRSYSTANRYFTPLLHCLSCCANDWGWIREVPKLPRLKEPPGRTRHLNIEEAKSVLAALEKDARLDFKLVALIAFTTGSRLNETCALRWESIDLEARIITFIDTKNGHPRSVPISERVYLALVEWQKGKTGEHVFPAEKGSRPYIYDKVKRPFRKLCEDLQLKDVTFHTLRHTAASWATQAGKNRRIIAELLGHRDHRTTDRYTHFDTSHLRPLVELMESNVLITPVAGNDIAKDKKAA